MRLSELGEFGLIDRIAKSAGATGARVICGIGDDCAVIESGAAGTALLVTTDLLIEGIHFRRETTAPRLLGRKILAANLSDVAAMGGAPHAFTVSLAAPRDLPVEWVEAVYEGIGERAAEAAACLVGGDTAASPGPIAISVTLLGECPTEEVIYRRGARPGDAIFVTGSPGESAAGLALLAAESAGNLDTAALSPEARADFDHLRSRHLDPEPRLHAGRALAARRRATALIDLSDGVAADLAHVLTRSDVGARLQAERLPLSGALCRACEHLALDPIDLALGGGEDYELLFSAGADLDEKVLSHALGLAVTRIGVITDRAGELLVLDPSGRERPLRQPGFEHFRP
jgi:thiamine-monophosphate kinase